MWFFCHSPSRFHATANSCCWSSVPSQKAAGLPVVWRRVMGQRLRIKVSTDNLRLVTALAVTTNALRKSILTLAACHGGTAGPWLEKLETELIRDTENVVFDGASMEAEAAAVEYALHHLKAVLRSEEHTSELQSRQYLVCRLLLEKKKIKP